MTGSWRLPSDARLFWHVWDDEYVVFNEASGDTHLLDPVSARLIDLLQSGPQDESKLIGTVGEVLGAAEDDVSPEAVQRALLELRDLGLAEAVTP